MTQLDTHTPAAAPLPLPGLGVTHVRRDGADVRAPAAAPDRPAGSSFTALTRQVHELGLMHRRYGYYWAKLVGVVLVLAGWVAGFVWLGDSWWQLVSAVVLAVLMTQTTPSPTPKARTPTSPWARSR